MVRSYCCVDRVNSLRDIQNFQTKTDLMSSEVGREGTVGLLEEMISADTRVQQGVLMV